MLAASVPNLRAPDPGELAALPNLWRASELARSNVPTISSGYGELDAHLPGGGWPRSSLSELLVQHSGIGEVQLLRPALQRLAQSQRIALIAPPHIPQAYTARAWGMDISKLLMLMPQSTSDALWCTEQMIRSGGVGAIILWQTQSRPEFLRRLNLALQSVECWLWMVRPLTSASEASPAPLRLALKPSHSGVAVNIIKRRGPSVDEDIVVPFADLPFRQPASVPEHATLLVPSSTEPASARIAPALV